MIWDDHQNRCIGELSFRSNVKAVKLRRDRVVVVLATKVYVYRFSDLKLLDQISTQTNPRGLVALCPHPAHTVLACPGVNRGHVRVELYDVRKSTIITAHETDLARLALSADGALVATASEKGTLLRVFDTHTGAQLRTHRRRRLSRKEARAGGARAQASSGAASTARPSTRSPSTPTPNSSRARATRAPSTSSRSARAARRASSRTRRRRRRRPAAT